MKTLAFAALALMLTSVSSAGSPGGDAKHHGPPWLVVGERERADHGAERLRALLERKRDGADRAGAVTSGHQGRTRVPRWDRGPDYKLRVIEPPRGVDYKIVCIRPDPSVDYKLRILGHGGRHVCPSPLTKGGKTIIIDPKRGGRRK